LVEVLRSSNVTLVSAPDQASMILRVISVTEDSRVASVDASGKVLEYQLRFQTQFDARDVKGEELIPSQTVTMTRTYLNPDVEVLGKQQEAATIRAEMIRDVADRIVRRLQTQAR
jgi:LPS-assembly lipoprotein